MQDPSGFAMGAVNQPTAIKGLTPQISRKILGVGEGATTEQINSAWRGILKKKAPRTAEELASRYNTNVQRILNEAKDSLLNDIVQTTQSLKLLGQGKNPVQGLMGESFAQTKARRAMGLSPQDTYQPVSNFEQEMNALAKKPVKYVKQKITEIDPIKAFNQADIKVISNEGKLTSGFSGLSDDIQGAYRDWVNQRRAVTIQGFRKRQLYKDLDNEGIEGFFKFQAGDKSGKYGELRKYFDTKYNQLKDAGIPFKYQKNYLTQLWSNSDKEINEVFGRQLGGRPGFTAEKIIENYRKGIEAGLTPRFNTVSEVAQWYEQRANKALADQKFFRFLTDEGLIMPKSKSPQGWVELNDDRFPIRKVKVDDKIYSENFNAPPELARLINNYLTEPDGTWHSIAAYASSVKNIILSAGIPKTALNFHGVNILARNTLARKNPVVGFLRGLNYLVRPGQAKDYLLTRLPEAEYAVKKGLTISSEDHVLENSLKLAEKNLPSKVKENFVKTVKFFGGDKQLFSEVIPALKLQYFDEIMADFSRHLPKDEAAERAAKVTNEIFGGINWEAFGRAKTTQDFLRAAILAPDWAETNIRMLGGIVRGVAQPRTTEGIAYRRILRNLMAIYATMSLTNKLTSGHWMHENEPGNTFSVQAGYTSDGKARYIRPLGTAADFVRLPADIALALAKGDPTVLFRTIRNRLSVPASVVTALLTNVNYRGQAIYGKTKYGEPMSFKESIGGLTSELSRALPIPPQVGATIEKATGRINNEEFLSRLIEAPTRYSGGLYSNTQKDIQAITGAKGKQLYEQNKELRGQSFGKNQLAAIKQSDNPTQTYQQILANRESEAKIKGLVEGSRTPTYYEDKYYYISPESGEVNSVDVSKPTRPKLTTDRLSNKSKVVKYQEDLDRQEKSVDKLLELQVISESEARKQKKDIQIEKLNIQLEAWDSLKPELTGISKIDKKQLKDIRTLITKRETVVIDMYSEGLISLEEAERELATIEKLRGEVGSTSKSKKKKLPLLGKLKFTKIKISGVKLPAKPKLKLDQPKDLKAYVSDLEKILSQGAYTVPELPKQDLRSQIKGMNL